MKTQTTKPTQEEKAPVISGHFKEDFIKWATKRSPFNFNKYTKTLTCFGKSFFDLPLAFQFNALFVFADEHEMCVHIEPYLGGGTPAYFASIKYRNEQRIDMQLDVDNSGHAEFWTRHEAAEAALIALNDLYNKQIEETELGWLKLRQKGGEGNG